MIARRDDDSERRRLHEAAKHLLIDRDVVNALELADRLDIDIETAVLLLHDRVLSGEAEVLQPVGFRPAFQGDYRVDASFFRWIRPWDGQYLWMRHL